MANRKAKNAAKMHVRNEFIALGRTLNAPPTMFADAFGFNCERAERLLVHRGLYKPDEETLGEALTRIYGREVAKECERLIDVSPFVAEEG